jgi:hypothetical protein
MSEKRKNIDESDFVEALGFEKFTCLKPSEDKNKKMETVLTLKESPKNKKIKDERPCVYLFRDPQGNVFYAGLANNGMRKRINQHNGGCRSKKAAASLYDKYKKFINKDISVWVKREFTTTFSLYAEKNEEMHKSTSIELYEQALIVMLKEKFQQNLVNFTRSGNLPEEIGGEEK